MCNCSTGTQLNKYVSKYFNELVLTNYRAHVTNYSIYECTICLAIPTKQKHITFGQNNVINNVHQL